MNEMKVNDELRVARATAMGRGSLNDLPKKLRPYTFGSYELAVRRNFTDGDSSKADALRTCKAYSESFSLLQNGSPIYNLLLVGGVGTGKTGLSVAILKEAIESGLHVMYMDFAVFMSECESSSLQDKQRSILAASRIDILVMDDLGTAERTRGDSLRTESADAIQVARQIFNTRSLHYRPTVVTTNLTVEGIGQQFGAPLGSRVIESSTVIWVGGRDMRLDCKVKKF